MQQNFQQPQNSTETQRIKRFLVKVLLNWYWIVIAAFTAYGYAYLKTRFMPVRYSISATLMLNDLKSNASPFSLFQDNLFTKSNRVQDEIGLLKSYFLNKRALNELDFNISYIGVGRSGYKSVNYYKNSPFHVELDSLKQTMSHFPIYITILDDKKYLVEIDNDYEISQELFYGEWFRHPKFNFRVFLNNPEKSNQYSAMGKFYFVVNSQHNLINSYRSKLMARLTDPGGSILGLTVVGNNSHQEVDYLKKIIEVYIQYGLDENNLRASNTIAFIDKQISVIKDSLRKAERRLYNYRQENEVLEDLSENNTIIDAIGKAKEETIRINFMIELLKTIRNQLIGNLKDVIIVPMVDMFNLSHISNYIDGLNSLIRQRKTMEYNLKRDNPALEKINYELEVQKKELIFFIDTYENKLKGDLRKEKEAFNRLEQQLKVLPYEKRKWMNLQKNFELYNSLYDLFVEKRTEFEITKASNVPSVRVLDAPMGENTVVISASPRKYRQRAIFIGALIPILFILIVEFFKNQIQDIGEIARNTKIPIVGIVSHVNDKEDLKIFENSRTPIAESFRILRTNLRYVLAEEKEKIITVTSSISGEGKSFSSLNLAAIYSFSGRKTLLVGLDIRKPKVHEYFGITNKKGISSYLANHASFEDVIYRSPYENFHICPSGPVPPNPVELIESSRLDDFLETAKKEFDIVIIDTPPIAVVADGIHISSYADINLFIVRLGYTNKNLFTLLNHLNTDKNIKNLYLVVNDVKSTDYYGYGHYNYYGRKYYTRGNTKSSPVKKILRKFKKKGSGYFG